MFFKSICKSVCKNFNIIHVRSYGKLEKVGDKIYIKRLITSDDVKIFTELTKDSNTLHEGRGEGVEGVVPGAFLNGLVSGVIGTNLFGGGSLVAEQYLKFAKPCYFNSEVTVCVTVKSVRKIVEVDFEVFTGGDDANKVICLCGNAKLFAPGKYSV